MQLIQLNSAQYCSERNCTVQFGYTTDYILIVMVNGSGILMLDDETRPLPSGHTMLIPPGTNTVLKSPAVQQENVWYQYCFNVYTCFQFCENNELLSMHKTRPDYLPLCNYDETNFPLFLSLAQKIYQLVINQNIGRETPTYWRIQSLMTQLVAELVQRQDFRASEEGQGIEQTASYIEQHYALSITRDFLAHMAHMSLSYYAHQFKKVYGMGPIDYLNEVRMRQAKLLLIRDRLAVQKVAEQTGFTDVFYFSRKFKKKFGVSPSVFTHKHTLRFATLNFLYGGDLLAIGLQPEQSVIDVKRDWQFSYGCTSNTLTMRSMRLTPTIVSANIQRLSAVRPDIIFCTPYELKFYDQQLLRKIAPTVVVPWEDMTWQDHLHCLGEYTGRRGGAEHWLSCYYSKAEDIRKCVHHRINGGTLSVFHILRGQLLVYGDRNGGSVLFRDLEIHPAYNLSEIEVYRVLEISDLPLYAGDFVLLSVDPDAASLALCEKIQHSSVWMQLDAVRWGQAFTLHEQPWIDYCAPAHEDILKKVLCLFESKHNIPFPN